MTKPTKLCDHGLCGTVRMAKMHVYLTPRDMLAVMDAIAATTADDLKDISEHGNPNGRALAAICRAWLKGRRS